MAPQSVFDLDEIRALQARVTALGVRHESIMRGFWNADRTTFGLSGPNETANHVTTACTAVLSFLDTPGVPLPRFFDERGFVDWLLSVTWSSEELPEHNVYTAPIALTALGRLAEDRISEPRAQTAVQFLVDELVSSKNKFGAVSYKNYPSSGFLTYWTIRGTSKAVDVYASKGWGGDRTRRDEVARGKGAIAQALHWAEDEAYRQIAFFSMNDLDRFDPLQMAYAAALVDLGRERQGRRPDRKLILCTLRILFESQLDDGLWSKGTPIFHYEGLGSVYPFAFETMAAVMHMAFRVASSTNDPAWTQFLHPYLPSLLRTLAWAESHELQGEHATGWRSNHVLPGNQPQAWATAMVLSFVRALDAVLQRITSEHVLTSFAARYLGKVDGTELNADNWTSLWDSDVHLENGDRTTLKRVLFSSVVTPHLNRADLRVWNMILSGPPGTAKTRLSEEIARALGWPLITMGTGDFLAEGADRLAGEARHLFRRLELLSDAVVLIDEVDEFVRKRDPEKTDRESRLVTTAMLTLLQGLKERKRVLLILATNSKDFDPAITRSGRMDLLLYVLPPSFESKRTALRDFLNSRENGQQAELIEAIGEAACRSAIERFTYLEWNAFLRSLSSLAGSLTRERLVGLILERSRDLALTDDEWPDWQGRRSEVHVY